MTNEQIIEIIRENYDKLSTDEIVVKICEELQLGIFSQSDISKMYDVPTWLVKDIKQRVTYKHISKDFIF